MFHVKHFGPVRSENLTRLKTIGGLGARGIARKKGAFGGLALARRTQLARGLSQETILDYETQAYGGVAFGGSSKPYFRNSSKLRGCRMSATVAKISPIWWENCFMSRYF
jgi:hypothetical protein